MQTNTIIQLCIFFYECLLACVRVCFDSLVTRAHENGEEKNLDWHVGIKLMHSFIRKDFVFAWTC